MAEDPYIVSEAQGYYAETDPTRHNGIYIKEERRTVRKIVDHHVELGRELCVPPFESFVPPAYSLCAVMGKDQVCEGEGGTARVVWCTTLPANGVVYTSIVGPTGPWAIRGSHSDYRQCHDVEFPVPALDATVWFYVESTTEDAEYLQSGVYLFCTGGEVTIYPTYELLATPSGTLHSVVAHETVSDGIEMVVVYPPPSTTVSPNQPATSSSLHTVVTGGQSVDTFEMQFTYNVTP